MPRRFPIAQWPNPPLWVAIAAFAISHLITGAIGATAEAFFFMAIGAWAYLEITKGVNWFRRALGVGVAAYSAVRLGIRLG